jgi:hypothetical protein
VHCWFTTLLLFLLLQLAWLLLLSCLSLCAQLLLLLPYQR